MTRFPGSGLSEVAGELQTVAEEAAVRAGRIRRQHFGRLDDLVVGAEVMRLLCEAN